MKLYFTLEANNAKRRLGRQVGLFILLVLLATCLYVPLAGAQVVTGDIVGTVTDTTGALVPGARVTIVNTETQLERHMESASTGDFVFTLLPPGTYNVRVEKIGFKTFEVKGLKLGTGARPRVDAHLDVGQAAETVTVAGDTVAVLQTDSATVQDVVTEKAVQDLPLNGRNLAAAVQQAAGVNQASPSSEAQGNRADDRRPGFAYAANGQSDMANNSMVDGLDNNEREQGFAGIRPSLDAIAEVRVLSNNYAAEIGRTAGAVVNIITKGGTNQFHGSAYEYLRNDVFDAKDFFASSTLRKAEYRQNVFGGSLGGPVIKNKTFFFGDVEANRTIQGIVSTATVPTAYEEANPGDFSDIGGPVVPTASINSIGLAYFKLYPTPTYSNKTLNNYVSTLNKTQYATSTDDRIDHQFGPNDTMFVRFGYNPTTTVLPGTFPDTMIGDTKVSMATGPSKARVSNVQANYIHLFNQNLVLELKAGFTRINIQTLPANYGHDLSAQIGFVDSYKTSDSLGLPYMWMLAGDYASIGDGLFVPIFDINNTFQYAGAVSYSHGSHNLKAGGALIRRQLNYLQDQWSPQGGWIFMPYSPYTNSLANMLVGSPSFSERGDDLAHQGLRSWEPNLYVQDDWHVRPWLTINAGVRWEAYTPITDAHNKFANFNMKTLKIEQAGKDTSASGGVATDYSDFSPRIGVEANLGHNLVARGGFGLSYYPPVMQTQVQNPNPPFDYICFPCFTSTFPEMPAPVASATSPVGTVSSIKPGLKNAYVRQYNFFLQKQFGTNSVSIGAVGENGRRGLYLRNSDRPLPPGAGVTVTPGYVYATEQPGVNNIQYIDNAGVTNYYGFELILMRQFSKGLSGGGNYTWGHGLSNSVQAASTYTNPSPALVTNDPMYDYGNSPLDVRHRVAGSLSYELPFGKNSHGFARTALFGWETSLIGFWETGLPFTVVDGSEFNGSNAYINLPGVTSDRPNQNHSVKLSNPSISKWFDNSHSNDYTDTTVAFSSQQVGTAGNEHSDSVYGPGSRELNAALLKQFTIYHELDLQFRAEFFNITNTPNFGMPGNTMSNSQFGIISATAANMTPRQMQFAMKLMF